MNDLDEWLQELGFNDASHNAVTTIVNTPPEEINAAVEEHSELQVPADAATSEPVTQELSEEDFDNILSDLGFEETPEADAEEITEVYDENQGEGRDLDIEEDEGLEDSEEPAIPRPDGSEALEAVQSVNGEEYPVGNPDAEDANMQHLRDLEQDAVEAYSQVVQEPLLPSNSPTLLMDDSTSRFSGTEWYNEIQKKIIILAGIGGIGSNLAFQIARLHPRALYLYDDDIVESGNMSGQMFGHSTIGCKKTNAMMSVLREYASSLCIFSHTERFTERTPTSDIMMCGFDNMEARKTFFNSWRLHVDHKPVEERKNCLLLDGRLSIDTLQVFCLTGDDEYNINRYEEEFLFSDSEAEETVCSMKQTTYMACMIASVITNLFVNFVANQLDPVIPYDLPFFTEYDSQNMIFRTIR